MFTSQRRHSVGSCLYFRIGGENSRSCIKSHPGLEREKYWEDYERVSQAHAYSVQSLKISHFHQLLDDLAQTTICEENLDKILSKSKRIYSYLSRMTEKRIMYPFYKNTMDQYRFERCYYFDSRFESFHQGLPELVKTKFNKLDSTILEAIKKPLPRISYDVRKYKKSVPTFKVREAPARINNKQPDEEPLKPRKRSSSLQILNVPRRVNYGAQKDVMMVQLAFLHNFMSVQNRWLGNVIKLTADLKSTDQYFSELHRKATTKRKQVKVLWDCLLQRIEELQNLYDLRYKMLVKQVNPLLQQGGFIANGNYKYQDSLANETKVEVEQIQNHH